jgi:hypothetical protein
MTFKPNKPILTPEQAEARRQRKADRKAAGTVRHGGGKHSKGSRKKRRDAERAIDRERKSYRPMPVVHGSPTP